MLSTISRWGNSLGVRIPRAIAEKIGISDGVPVEIIAEDDHILIQKVYRLESLLAEITPENIHSEEIITAPRGKEIW